MVGRHNVDAGCMGNGRRCRVCGRGLVGRQIKYCADCAVGMLRTTKKDLCRAGASCQGGGPLAGMSVDGIARLAWDTYHMSYGRLVGYVAQTGQLPPRQ